MNKERAIEILTDLYNHELIIFKNNADEPSESEYTNIDVKQALKIAIDSLENEWQTDTPKESGYYLVTNGADKLDIRKYDNGWYHDMYRRYTDEELEIIAWKKVEPYERKE